MKLIKVIGITSELWQIFIQDSSSTVGAGLTGLAFNTASLTAYYHRDTDTTATAITLATMTVGTFTSSGFKEIDATNMPGWYQFCPPNAALASGAKSCGFQLKGATNMAQLNIEVQLTAGFSLDTANPAVNAAQWNALTTVALPLIPTTAGRTLDVSATGEAGIDWSNVGAPTTSLALTGTTIAVTQKVDVETIKTNPVVNGGTITFPTNSTIATTVNILTTALTESYAADGAAPTLAQLLFGIQAFLQERSVSGVTLTTKKIDGSTTAMTFTLNDATTPTAITRAT